MSAPLPGAKLPPPQNTTAVQEAYEALLRHQPAANAVGYEHTCATCSYAVPCFSRQKAETVLATHGHNPHPTPAEVEVALHLPLIG
jgi:hypothetical protein